MAYTGLKAKKTKRATAQDEFVEVLAADDSPQLACAQAVVVQDAPMYVLAACSGKLAWAKRKGGEMSVVVALALHAGSAQTAAAVAIAHK